MSQLSVVITAHNEEKKIEDCLRSVKFTDEIIFIDCSSTDKTATIAKKYTKHIFKRENNLMLNVNKNYGFSKAKHEWILSLDADERISPELSYEIKKIVKENPKVDGYWIPRKNIIFGKWIEHTGWYPDHQFRLFRKNKGKFAEKHVHEMIHIDGESDYLKEHIEHLNFENISQFIQKQFLLYAPNEADQLIENGYSFNFFDAIRMPMKEFLSRFFARQGYKDGFYGLMLSLLMASYHLVIFSLLWEKKGFKQLEEKDVLLIFNNETKTFKKELIYWISELKIKSAKNIVSKIRLKLKRKFS